MAAVRPARPEDVHAIADVLHRANATYREWDPRATPPSVAAATEEWRVSLAEPERRTVVTEVDGEVVGFASWLPEREERGTGAVVPGVGHVSSLFVVPEHWGRGVGGALHAAAIEDLAGAYREARLWTGVANVRARRFYERRGWALSGREDADEALGLEMVEYVLPLDDRG